MSSPVQTDLDPRGQPAGTVHGSGDLRDSMSGRFVLLRYIMIALITGAIDNLAFYLVFRATGSIAGAQTAGRIASVLFNYRAVRQAVFRCDRQHHAVLPRYLSLIAVNALISYAVIRLLSAITPLSVIASKLLTETLLFAANFIIQRAFIFTRRAAAVSPPAARPSAL